MWVLQAADAARLEAPHGNRRILLQLLGDRTQRLLTEGTLDCLHLQWVVVGRAAAVPRLVVVVVTRVKVVIFVLLLSLLIIIIAVKIFLPLILLSEVHSMAFLFYYLAQI